MRICQTHWAALRKAIDDRGLTGLVTKDGHAAVDSMVRQIEGTDTKADFDPLMNANWAIMSAYLRDAGLAGMIGERCPLCEVEARSCLAEDWINGAADDQLNIARELGLIPKPQ